jgi:hypothetical protein
MAYLGNKRKSSNTEALKPLIVKPKENSTVFKGKMFEKKSNFERNLASEKSDKSVPKQLKPKFPGKVYSFTF